MAQDFQLVVSSALNGHGWEWGGVQTWQKFKKREEEADGLKRSGELEGFRLMRVGKKHIRSRVRGKRPDICGWSRLSEQM